MINIGNAYNWKLLHSKCKWSEQSLENFMQIFDKYYTKEEFNQSLYNIIDYGLPFDQKQLEDNYGKPEYFHEKGIYKFFQGKTNNKPQTFDELIKTLEKDNSNRINNGISQQVLDNLRNSYNSIKNKTENLKNMTCEEIKQWAEKIKKEKEKDIDSIIAHINQLFIKIFEFDLRPTQIISVLLLLKKEKKFGRIAQILTGEGKTATIITLASVNVILGHKVDIITSSEILAKRDAENEKNKKIYESLGITVDHCIKDKNNHERGPRKCYLADIVYGDAHNFQGDILSDKYMLEGTRNNRDYDVAIVDEIDSMFVDDYGKSTLLSSEKPYMKRLNYILISMWIYLRHNIDTENWTIEEMKKNKESIVTALRALGEKILKENKSIYPKYLYDYAKDQLNEKWPNSAIEAALMVENERYLINNGKVEPIDNENTGVIQHNTHLSYGLQQFLQLKHNCSMTSVSNISSYLSNVGFFKLYINKEKDINNIFGLTGTLGSQTAQNLLRDIYNLDFVFVPPASQRMLHQLTPRLEKNDIDWMKSILNTCLREANSGREVLIICKSIKIVKDIKKKLEKEYKGSIYTLKDDIEAEQNLVELEPGSIIIATNLAGRGTDIPISKKILKKGGMHVCLTFLPVNTRVQEQAFGRTGRKGQPGTWQLVLNIFKDYPVEYVNKLINSVKEASSFESVFVRKAFEKNNSEKKQYFKNIEKYHEDMKKEKINIYFEILDKIREENETKMLNGARAEIEKVIKKDDLFIKYTDVLKKDFKGLETTSRLFSDIEEQWGFFLNRVEGKTEEEIQKEFSKFINDLKDAWSSDKLIMKNSGFICQRASRILYSNVPDRDEASILENVWNTIKSWFSNEEEEIKNNIRRARNFCNNDIKNNPDLSFISYYYKAIADIFLGYTSDAYKELKKSIDIIKKDITFLGTFICMISGAGFEKLSEDLGKKFQLYNNIKDAILEESKKLVSSAERKILIKKKKFINVFSNLEEKKIEEEINSLSIIGFDYVFFLYEKAPFWKSFGMVLFGAFQICLGCLISSVPLVGHFSENLINNGIANIGRGVEMMMNGKDIKNWKEFWDFQKAGFFQEHFYSQLIIERDEKKKYNFYKNDLKKNDVLRQKITINRENAFKNFIETKLKEIDLNLEEEKNKIENLEKNMDNIKKAVAEKVMEGLEKSKGYRNVFLYFNGDIDKIRNYLMNKVNSQLIDFDISKEINADELTNQQLIEKIAERIKDKIEELIEKDEDIKKNSQFLVNLKNYMFQKSKENHDKEIKEKNDKLKLSFKEENEKFNKKIEELNQNKKKEEVKLDNEKNQKKEKQKKEMEDKKNVIQNQIKEFEEKQKKLQEEIKTFNEKIESFNKHESDITSEELETAKSTIETEKGELQNEKKTLDENINNYNELNKSIEGGLNKIEEEHNKGKEELEKNFEDLNKIINKEYNDAIENIEKDKKSFQEEIKKKSEENIKNIKDLNNDDIGIDQGRIIYNAKINENMANDFINKYNIENEQKLNEMSNYWTDKIGYISNEQVSKIEAKENNKLEKNRKVKIDNLKSAINKEGNPVVKCYSQNYEYFSPDMEIIGKQILKEYPEFEYFIYNNIDTLKKLIQKKKILIGNYNDSKSWNTVCIIPDGNNFIILYKNPKGLPYDKNFEQFLRTIGVEEYTIKINGFDQSKDIEKSSCIFSLKNLESFSSSLRNDKQNYINNFETIKFKEFSENDLGDIRENEFVHLYLKDIYEKIKKIRNEKNDTTPIDLMEIIDFCTDRKYTYQLFDCLDTIYEQLEKFVTDEEKIRFKESIKKYKREKHSINDN